MTGVRIVCCVCQRGLPQVEHLTRVNAKGRPGVWACEHHVRSFRGPRL